MLNRKEKEERLQNLSQICRNNIFTVVLPALPSWLFIRHARHIHFLERINT